MTYIYVKRELRKKIMTHSKVKRELTQKKVAGVERVKKSNKLVLSTKGSIADFFFNFPVLLLYFSSWKEHWALKSYIMAFIYKPNLELRNFNHEAFWSYENFLTLMLIIIFVNNKTTHEEVLTPANTLKYVNWKYLCYNAQERKIYHICWNQ